MSNVSFAIFTTCLSKVKCQLYTYLRKEVNLTFLPVMAVAGKVGKALRKERVGIYNVGIMSVEASSESVDGC